MTGTLTAIGALAFAFIVSDLSRSVNAVLASILRNELRISEIELGVMSATFYLAFIISQIPIGIALDRWGPKHVQIVLLPIATTGAFLCGVADGFVSFGVGRLLLGIGLAGSLVAAFKGITIWVNRNNVPRANGIVLALGALGGVLATWPASEVASLFGWRSVYMVTGTMSLISWISVILFVPTSQEQTSNVKPKEIFTAFKLPGFRGFVWPAAFAVGTASAFQGLWMGVWLSDIGKLTQSNVSYVLLIASVTTVLGSLSIGYLATYLSRYGLSVERTLMLGIILFTIIEVLLLKYPASIFLWGAFAFFGTAGMLGFALISSECNSSEAGAAIALYNLMTFIAAFSIQVAFGSLIELFSEFPYLQSFDPINLSLAILISIQIFTFSFFGVKRAGARS